MYKTLFFVLLALYGLTTSAQGSKNLSLVGRLPFNYRLADVQAYVAPDGSEYALVGHRGGVGIVSLADPSQPALLHTLSGVLTTWREIETKGEFAYVTNEGGNGLRIIDLRGLPGTAPYRDVVLDGMVTAHTLFIEGTVLYLYGGSIDNGGVSIYSIANPWNPVRLGAYTGTYVHDAYVRDGIGYLSEIYDGKLEVVDLSDPARPRPLGVTHTPSRFTHNSWLNDGGTVCFTTDEVAGSWVTAYDITDLNNIQELDRIRPSYAQPGSLPHNVKVLNDWLVTAHYYEGVHLVDASRPHNLIETGYYDTNTQVANGFEGVWGADPYLPSGLIVAGDRQRGLHVFQPTYVRACYLEGVVTDAVTGQPLYNADISAVGQAFSDVTAPDGEYATGTVDAGIYQVKYAKFGYYDTTLTVALSNGALVLQDVALRPKAAIAVSISVVDAGGVPLAGSKVNFEAGSGGPSMLLTGSSFNLTSFVPGDYVLQVGHWGHRLKEFALQGFTRDTAFTVVLDKGYEDDFVLDFGWTTSGTATDGDWVRVKPVGTRLPSGYPLNPDTDMQFIDVGEQCYVTGNEGSSSVDDDVDQGWVMLSSPVMDLTGYQQPVLSYYRWFATLSIQGTWGGDTLRVVVDNGTQSVVVHEQTSSQVTWLLDTFELANLIPLTATMQVHFIAKEEAFDNAVEAGLDMFRVYDAAAVSNAPFAERPLAKLVIAPNPGREAMTVTYDVGRKGKLQGVQFELYDLQGRCLHKEVLRQEAGAFVLDLDLAAGMYVGSIRSGDQVLGRVKVARE